jgi:hypothetical protein
MTKSIIWPSEGPGLVAHGKEGDNKQAAHFHGPEGRDSGRSACPGIAGYPPLLLLARAGEFHLALVAAEEDQKAADQG